MSDELILWYVHFTHLHTMSNWGVEQDSFIRGAINLPAHSFYPTLQSLMPILIRYSLVVFHCNNCKPTGRGPRTAAWYQDELDKRGLTESRAAVLEGGFKGWINKYGVDELTSKL